MLKPGDPAPDFSLKDGNGDRVSLSQFRGQSVVVLYFYPRDNTPGCTAQACSFRDRYHEFKDLGAEVIGISSDSDTSHARFSVRHRLPFILLSDPDGYVREQYGVPNTFGLLPGRVTFVIDRDGIIHHTFSSQFKSRKHVDEAMVIVRRITNQPGA